MTDKKKTILVFTKYYLPAYKSGGPVRSVSNLVEWCGNKYQFKIITGDRDSFENKPFRNVKLNEWNRVGNAEVFYIKKEKITPTYLFRLLKNTEYDLIYLNSFFRLQFSILPLFLYKFLISNDLSNILLAPRGEFSKGALEIKSFKKRWFIRFIKYLGIYKRIKWQAASEVEVRDIKRVMEIKKNNIFLIPNLPPQKTGFNSYNIKKETDTIKIIYLSRVSPKKNLIFALQVINNITNVTIQFDIYGLIDDQRYWNNCKHLIDSMSDIHTINYKGAIEHELVLDTNSKYHLFFLPTKGENYGHAIYEALIAGTPVLISDQTPWRKLEKKKMGWDISLSHKNKFSEIIKKIGRMNQRDITRMKQGVRESILKLDIDEDVAKARNVFNKLMA